jgi:hypothetical protein
VITKKKYTFVGAAKKKLPVVYTKSTGLTASGCVRIVRASGNSVTRYLKAHKTHSSPFAAYVAQVSHHIEKLTGNKLSLSACRDFMRKHPGVKCRKMVVIPSGQSR